MTRNPNSQIVTTSKTWSELPSDILISVFERLGFADFRRAKSVCYSWNSASRQSVPKIQIPWLILLPEKDNTNNSCTLFNLEEKDKLYKVKDLGLDYAKSVCVAIYGNWLLVRDPVCNLYIVNLFTKERINLPPLEAQRKPSQIKRTRDRQILFYLENKIQRKVKGFSIKNPVFWVDEITKDYIVVWGFSSECCLVYAKKGDDLWTQIPDTSHCCNPFYKDHKLYFFRHRDLKIFDFSGEKPPQTFREENTMHWWGINQDFFNRPWRFLGEKYVVTVTGDILRVRRKLWNNSCTESFLVHKVYSSGDFVKYDEIDSLGDEAIFYDLGVTVLANGVEGLKRNSIYFNGLHDKNATKICIYNLETREVEQLHQLDCSLVQFSNARWFLPSFRGIPRWRDDPPKYLKIIKFISGQVKRFGSIFGRVPAF